VVNDHMLRSGPAGLALEGSNVGSPNLISKGDVSEDYWTILDRVALDHPFEVNQRGVGKPGVEVPSLCSSLQLLLEYTSLAAFCCLDRQRGHERLSYINYKL
jgi:hypothetical protein